MLNRNRAGGHLTPMADYFAPDAPLADNFRRCFRMRKTVFDCLYRVGRSYDDYFILKKDAWERLASLVTESARPHSARLLIRDEYLRMSESTCGDAMIRFATAVVEVFGPQYLKEPTATDTDRLLAISNPVVQEMAHFAQRQEEGRKMSRGYLEFCRPDLQLFVDLLNNGVRKPCGR